MLINQLAGGRVSEFSLIALNQGEIQEEFTKTAEING